MCDTRAHCLILDYLASARGRVLERSHFLILHSGEGLGGGSSLVVGERSNRAGSTSFSGLLQPAVCGGEGLRVVEAGHRPFVIESEGSEDFFQDGDSPVRTFFGSERGLDGVSRLEGCILASSDASGKPQVP